MFAYKSVIYLNARKCVYFLLYVGAHIDADVLINVITDIVTDYNLRNLLAIIVRIGPPLSMLQKHDFFWLHDITCHRYANYYKQC